MPDAREVLNQEHSGHIVNCLREDGTTAARFFDTRTEAVEYAVSTVIWNKFAVVANIWMETHRVGMDSLGPPEFEFVAKITRQESV